MAPISLPTMIVHSSYGKKEVKPSIWNARTLKFSEGMPQKIVVKKGDSLFSLSKKYAVPIPLIIGKNHLKPPFFIYPGQTLILVGPKIHIVQKDENLYEIAITHKVSVSALARQNKLLGPQALEPGQQLILPAENTVMKDEASFPAIDLSTSKKQGQKLEKVKPFRSSTLTQALTKLSLQPRAKFFTWPVRGRIISGFGPKGKGLYNDGINIAAPHGAIVSAVESGVVVYQGADIKSYGNLILVKHNGGWMTAYAHLSKVSVHKGQVIKKKETLGLVGNSGFVTEPQLHFEIRKNGKPLNPFPLIK